MCVHSWQMELGTGDMRLHNVLEALQIPHKVITLEQFPLAKIYPSQTMYMNCWDENQAALLTEDMIQKLVRTLPHLSSHKYVFCSVVITFLAWYGSCCQIL